MQQKQVDDDAMVDELLMHIAAYILPHKKGFLEKKKTLKQGNDLIRLEDDT